ncbi:hypothetical protein [Nevskia sp.]|uniref:hypothetical protein n=1 Tax=Nevskia sp. TaxID=1929292 RepID=UPI0025DD10BC|nr:hypothetical protein [Nevskia sp.]
MTRAPMLQHLSSDLASAISHGWQAIEAAEWLPLVAVWGLGLCAVEGVEHLAPQSPETRHPV